MWLEGELLKNAETHPLYIVVPSRFLHIVIPKYYMTYVCVDALQAGTTRLADVGINLCSSALGPAPVVTIWYKSVSQELYISVDS